MARGIARRSLWVAPVWLALSGIVWGVGGAASSGFGLLLVVANLLAAAASMAWAVRISPVALMITVMVGFALRLALLLLAVWAVSGLSLFEPIPLAITIGVSHLGLLAFEMRYVSLSLSPAPVAAVGSQVPQGATATPAAQPVRTRPQDAPNEETM